jgi:hypothetical protein
MGRIARAIATMLTVLSGALVGPAQAQEYCVACSGPDALYRCIIEGAQAGGGQPLQMLCITAIAKQDGHATCSVKRGTVFDCDGAIRRIPWAPLEATPQQPDATKPLPWAATPAPKPEPAAAPASAPKPAPPPEAKPDAPPETMLELAKRANEDTVKQMKKAGETVQNAGETVKQATKKTWDCVISFFTRC